MDIYPFTPHGLPTWAIIGIVCSAVVAVPVFLGGIGMYLAEALRHKGPRRPTKEGGSWDLPSEGHGG